MSRESLHRAIAKTPEVLDYIADYPRCMRVLARFAQSTGRAWAQWRAP